MGTYMILMRKGCSSKMDQLQFLEQSEKGLAATMSKRRGDRQPQEEGTIRILYQKEYQCLVRVW